MIPGPGPSRFLLPTCVLSFAAAVALGPSATLYGMGLARITFGVSIIRAALLLVLMLLGIQLWGAVGAAWALAVTELVLLPMWLLRTHQALRRPIDPQATDATQDGDVPAAGGPSLEWSVVTIAPKSDRNRS